MAPRICVAVALVAALGGVGCGSNPRTVEFKDQGKLCLWPNGTSPVDPTGTIAPVLTYPADRPVRVSITMPTCLSSSCSKEPRATCAVTMLAATELQVGSEGSYREEGSTCTTDCGFLVAVCDSTALPAGTYTVRHGTEQAAITLPSMTRPPCVGTAP